MTGGIQNSFPISAARAYDVATRRSAPPSGPSSAPDRPFGRVDAAGATPSVARRSDVSAVTPTGPTAAVDAVRPRSAPSSAAAERIARLVGGQVTGGVAFSGSAPIADQSDILPMYTRAADKVEASVAIRLGGSLDLRG